MLVQALQSIQNFFRCRAFAPVLLPFMENCQSVLDVGTSTGALAASVFRDAPEIRLAGVDVVVDSQPLIPMILGNGRRLPFSNDAFDCVMMIDVLHHVDSPRELLAEAKRVSQKSVLIKDHYWGNRLDLLMLRFQDYIGNKPYGIDLPYNFLDMKTWDSLFKSVDLRVRMASRFRLNAIDLRKHVIFELEK